MVNPLINQSINQSLFALSNTNYRVIIYNIILYLGRSSQQILLGFTERAPEQVYYNDLF